MSIKKKFSICLLISAVFLWHGFFLSVACENSIRETIVLNFCPLIGGGVLLVTLFAIVMEYFFGE